MRRIIFTKNNLNKYKMEYASMTDRQAEADLKRIGLNQVDLKQESILAKIRKAVLSPMTTMLLAASGLSYHLNKIFDSYFILALIFMNIGVSVWHEKKADNTLKKLRESLAIRINVLRGGKWKIVDSERIVPNDIVRLHLGSIVPADLVVLESKKLSLNESALTGESLPIEKKEGDSCFAGTHVSSGLLIGKITATGKHTRFGQTLISIEGASKRSLLEKDILSISRFLIIISLIAITLLSIFFLVFKKPIGELIQLDLSLLIAGVPVALPTVMTLILSIGMVRLARKHVIVRNASSLENLSNVNWLLSDKTGTLTENAISVVKVVPYEGFSKNDVVKYALYTEDNEENPIQSAMKNFARRHKIKRDGEIISDFMPFDSERKRSTAWVLKDGKKTIVSFGAPQIIRDLCKLSPEEKKYFDEQTESAAKEGYRSVSVAILENGEKEVSMQPVGTILFSDVLRPEAPEIIRFLRQHGIHIKMITGDNVAVSRRMAESLGLKGDVLDREKIKAIDFPQWSPEAFKATSVFSEILPIDKYRIVETAKKQGIVAVTGDGINDIPSVRAADVGIAVFNAVDALKASADIILLQRGIATIRDAIIEARKIFVRLSSYGIYRISESARVIVSTFILALWYNEFPLQPIHLIILALLNDIPIISLAYNRVEIPKTPARLDIKSKATSGSLFGGIGVLNSILFFVLLKNVLHLEWEVIQTLFFLKLTVSGHLLVYVAHTKRKWYKFLPSKQVIIATVLTQLLATCMAFFGFLMTGVSLLLVLLVWAWSFFWMQVSDFSKRWQH